MAANDYFPDLPDTEDFLDEFAQRMANHTWQNVQKIRGDGTGRTFKPDFNQIDADDPQTSLEDIPEEVW